MKKWWRSRRPYVLSGAIYSVARFIYSTLRLKVIGLENIRPTEVGKVYCGWHGHSLIGANFFRKQDIWAIISQSRDGEMQARIFSKFGFNLIRGSTGRGGAKALVQSIGVLKEGAQMVLTPDGPRGPSGVVQQGIMLMAKKSGCALIPVGNLARPAWHAPTWDRYLVPFPFAKAVMMFGDPVFVSLDASDAEVEEIRLRLQNEINRLQEACRRELGMALSAANGNP